MKKFLIFSAGFVSGIVFLLIVSLIVAGGNDSPTSISGLTMFERPAEVIDSSSFEVMQVIPGDNALAHAKEEEFGVPVNGLLVLFLADESTHYYDEQIIEVPNNKCVQQVGTFQYETKNGDYKTVPAVRIFDK